MSERPTNHMSLLSEPQYAKLQKNRVACERCRALKVRCDVKDAGELQSCLRCQKSNLQCVPDRNPAPKRKRPHRVAAEDTDRRIEQLEEALIETRNAIRFIHPNQPVQNLARHQVELPLPQLRTHKSDIDLKHSTVRSLLDKPISIPTPPSSAHCPSTRPNYYEALLISGKVTLTQTQELFQHFKNVLLPTCPHVCVQDMPYEQMRVENPLKLHAIIAGVLNTTVCSKDLSLDEGLRSHFAERLHGAMGTDVGLIESMLIMLYWSSPSDDSKRLSYSLMLASIAHSLCVFNAVREESLPTLQIKRLSLIVYVALGSICQSMKVVPMIQWSSALQCARDELLQNSESRDDYRLTVSASIVQLEQEMSSRFDANGQTLEPSSVESMITEYNARIEDLKAVLFTTTLHIFGYYSLKFVLFDRASRYLPKTNPSYINCIREAVSALQSTVEYFISCKHLFDTFPTYISVKPIRAIMSMFKICACVDLPSSINVDPQNYMYKLLQCLSTAKQISSVVKVQQYLNSMVDRFCLDNNFSEKSALSTLWKREIVDTISHQKREEDWGEFMKSFNIQQSEVDFWDQIGL